MPYRCCTHCAADSVHDVPTDRHTTSCGGKFGTCSTGGDEWVESDDIYDSDWTCSDCGNPLDDGCSCG